MGMDKTLKKTRIIIHRPNTFAASSSDTGRTTASSYLKQAITIRMPEIDVNKAARPKDSGPKSRVMIGDATMVIKRPMVVPDIRVRTFDKNKDWVEGEDIY